MEPVPEQPDGVRKAILRHGVSRRSGSRESTPGGIRSRHSSGSSRGSRLSRRISRAFSLRRGAEVLPVRDLILLDSISEDNVVTVLKKRFQDDQIYTYIGSVVVSINPYKNLSVYDDNQIARYRGGNYWDPGLEPHVYSLTDAAYSDLRFRGRNQCVIISGESGSGKTEASKIIMRYVAAVSPGGGKVDEVKTKLLKTNPVLEAFGNAKTVRNDNSSRFGKYMDIQFDYHGNPVGGKVTTYLLEKARVIRQNNDERCFHIFYQLLAGGPLASLHLQSDPTQYAYLKAGNCVRIKGTNDAANFKEVQNSLKYLGFSENDQNGVFQVLAAVLLLGQLQFDGQGEASSVSSIKSLSDIAKLLNGSPKKLEDGLTHKTVVVEGKLVSSPLQADKASYSRHSLAKTLYERLFIWLCGRINENLCVPDDEVKAVIGVLDIYGFEIFSMNGFEQFCINYCNEKLQQLFIELTLRTEQQEYQDEGITWVEIKYFNNRIICDLIDKKPSGVMALLDEECIRPGDKSDLTWLSKLDQAVGRHDHYKSREVAKDRTLPQDVFILKHYAGEVRYTVDGFVDKNTDTLFKDLSQAMYECNNPLLKALFPEGNKDLWLGASKRPVTAGAAFKTSMASMISELNAKIPSYIRCIKPNEKKRPNQFDAKLVLNQVRYLGLVENVRVRRAGFCYRVPQDKFLERFKLICPHTYPLWSGTVKEGVNEILLYIGILADEYQFGRTKVFIKNPQTVFRLEKARDDKIASVVTKLQRAWRAFVIRRQRGSYVEEILQIFSKVKDDPHFGRKFKWPRDVPRQLLGADKNLKKIHANWWADKKLLPLFADQRDALRVKVYAWRCYCSEFRERDVQADVLQKPLDLAQAYRAIYVTHISGYEQKSQALCAQYHDSKIRFASEIRKVNRAGKLDKRVLLLADKHLFKLDTKFKVTAKRIIALHSISAIHLNKTPDTFVVLKLDEPGKDAVLDLGASAENRLGEFVSHLFLACRHSGNNRVKVNVFDGAVEYNNSQKAAGARPKVLTFRGETETRKSGEEVCRFQRQTVFYPSGGN